MYHVVYHKYVRSTLPLLHKTESRLLPYRKAQLNKRRIPLLNTHVEHVYIRCLLACLLSLRHDHHDRDEHVGGVKHTTSSYSPNMIVNVRYVSVMGSKPCIWSVQLHLSNACKSALPTSCVSWNGHVYLSEIWHKFVVNNLKIYKRKKFKGYK